MRVLIATAVLAGSLPAAALAQGNDPSAGSPSGTIYEIPLDNARHDAAPRTPGGGNGGGTTAASPSAPATSSPSTSSASPSSSGSASSIHSENGFGSSAQVPGVPVTGAGGKRHASKTASASQPNPEALIHPAAHVAEPSSTRAYILIALAVAVAIALGAAARLAARRR
jgi:hypothetical protein